MGTALEALQIMIKIGKSCHNFVNSINFQCSQLVFFLNFRASSLSSEEGGNNHPQQQSSLDSSGPVRSLCSSPRTER